MDYCWHWGRWYVGKEDRGGSLPELEKKIGGGVDGFCKFCKKGYHYKFQWRERMGIGGQLPALVVKADERSTYLKKVQG